MQAGMRSIDIEGLEKIYLLFSTKEWHGYSSESVWAQIVDHGYYKIMNIPFYYKGLGLYDIVRAEKNDAKLYFKSIIERSGHSTYRLILNSNTNEEAFEKYWEQLEHQGCTYEKAKKGFYAVDVPPSSDIYKVYSLLGKGENDSIWEFEEGYCQHY